MQSGRPYFLVTIATFETSIYPALSYPSFLSSFPLSTRLHFYAQSRPILFTHSFTDSAAAAPKTDHAVVSEILRNARGRKKTFLPRSMNVDFLSCSCSVK